MTKASLPTTKRASRLSSAERAAYDFFDHLLYFQQFVHLAADQEVVHWLKSISDEASTFIETAGYTGTDAAVVKHSAYAALEAYAVDDLETVTIRTGVDVASLLPDPALKRVRGKLAEYHRRYVAARLSVLNAGEGQPSAARALQAPALGIAEALLAKVSDAPSRVRHRLSMLLLAYEYPEAPLHALSWLRDCGVITTGRSKPSGGQALLDSDVVVRLGLAQQMEAWRPLSSQEMRAGPWVHQSHLDVYTGHISHGAMLALLEHRWFYQRQEDQVRYLGATRWIPSLELRRLDEPGYVREFFGKCGEVSHHLNRLVTQKTDLVAVIGASLLMVLRKRGASLEASADKTSDRLSAAGFAYSADSLRRQQARIAPSVERSLEVLRQMQLRSDSAWPFHMADPFHLAVVLATLDVASLSENDDQLPLPPHTLPPEHD